eukprot:2081511-Amphidinium_carterae.1
MARWLAACPRGSAGISTGRLLVEPHGAARIFSPTSRGCVSEACHTELNSAIAFSQCSCLPWSIMLLAASV